MPNLPDSKQLQEFLAKASPNLHLLDRFLADHRRQLLERMPHATTEHFAELKAQISFIDMLTGDLREDLKRFWQQETDKEKDPDGTIR